MARYRLKWGFPKIRGTFLEVPIPHNKDYSVFGSILGFPYFGNLPNACWLLVGNGK